MGLIPRRAGSHSKIRLVADGLATLATILALFRDDKPLTFFGGAGAVVLIGGSLAVLATVACPGSEQAPRLDPGALVGLVSALAGGLPGLASGNAPTQVRRARRSSENR